MTPTHHAYGQGIRDRAFEFACQIVAILAPQILPCGTSIGANLEEARESLFRLRVADRCQLGSKGKATALAREATELAAIIGAIVRNARRILVL